MNVRIKICGLCRTEDARLAWTLGADALGMVFHDGSTRVIRAEVAAQICAEAPPRVSRVGVFVNPTRAEVKAVLNRVDLDILQFHGRQTGKFCASFERPFIKAVAMSEAILWQQLEQEYEQAQALLLDTAGGGTGEVFDWSLWPRQSNLPLILAGGLTAENVAAAIQATSPFAVDVSSGVESAVKAIKDPQKMAAFVAAVSRINEHSR